MLLLKNAKPETHDICESKRVVVDIFFLLQAFFIMYREIIDWGWENVSSLPSLSDKYMKNFGALSLRVIRGICVCARQRPWECTKTDKSNNDTNTHTH